MKQPEDKKTIDLLDSVPVAPRRGRPPKPHALSGAERAKRFRDARRSNPQPVTEIVTVIGDVTDMVTGKEFRELQRTEQHLAMSLMTAYSEIRRFTQKIADLEAEIVALKSRRKSVKN